MEATTPVTQTRFYAKTRDGKYLKRATGHIRTFTRYTDACEALDLAEPHNDQPFIAEHTEYDSGIDYRTVKHRS